MTIADLRRKFNHFGEIARSLRQGALLALHGVGHVAEAAVCEPHTLYQFDSDSSPVQIYYPGTKETHDGINLGTIKLRRGECDSWFDFSCEDDSDDRLLSWHRFEPT